MTIVNEAPISEKPFNNKAPGSHFVNGREFTDQENVQYILPKDVQELDRLHQQHWMLKFAFQGNFKAPIEEDLKRGIRVLDSGCGPGTWTLEMAKAFPNSKFHGMDMAPVFPKEVATNCEFRLGNLNETLPYPDNYFDYIHQRFLVAGLTAAGWEKALKEFTRVLKPGGWIELIEIQIHLNNLGPLGEAVNQTMIRVFKSKKLFAEIANSIGPLLEKNDIQDVNISKLSLPINHSGELGSLFWNNFQESLSSLKPILAAEDPDAFGDDESFAQTIDALEVEFAEYKSTGTIVSAFGQKPFA